MVIVRNWSRGPLVGFVLFATSAVFAAYATACPFCGGPSLTLTEQVASEDVVVLAELVEAQRGATPSTRFRVVEVLRDSTTLYKKDRTLQTPVFRGEDPGTLFLVTGQKIDTLMWSEPIPTTRPTFEYLRKAPSSDAAPKERLTYCLPFLEHEDLSIANDAFNEFANASYADIVLVAGQLPLAKLRSWALDPRTVPTRLALYGLLLGLCGNDSDAALMEQRILEVSEDEFRAGMEGVVAGYLLLRQEQGLAVIEKTRFLDKQTPFTETYAAFQAVEFMWQYGDGKISKERLRASIRLLLDRPEMADQAIRTLARWKDWSVQNRLREMYGRAADDNWSIKKAIIRYMIASTADPGENHRKMEKPAVGNAAGGGSTKSAVSTENGTRGDDGDVRQLPHVAQGRKYLDEFREKDAELVKSVEQSLY